MKNLPCFFVVRGLKLLLHFVEKDSLIILYFLKIVFGLKKECFVVCDDSISLENHKYSSDA